MLVDTTVDGTLPVYYGHQWDKWFSLLLCSYVVCGLVGNWFKLVEPNCYCSSSSALVNLEVNTGLGPALLTAIGANINDVRGFGFPKYKI